MRRALEIAFVVGVVSSSGLAQLPEVAVLRAPCKPVTTHVAPTMAGLGVGGDACTDPHLDAGVGDVTGVLFDPCAATTGTTGQAERLCDASGQTGIDRDLWFDWTASMTGSATLETCGRGVDTKVAIWPNHSPSWCPPDGASLACNDDACGLASRVTWSCTAGTTYTIQIGLYPGAACGPCAFDITQGAPLPCGQKDDGSTESALGWTDGGEIGWMTVFTTGPGTCLATWDSVEAAYGSLMFPGSVTNGSASTVVVYRDADTDSDPNTGLTLTAKVDTLVLNGDTDILNKVPLGVAISDAKQSHVWVLASNVHAAGQFPAPIDVTPPFHVEGTWFVGSTLLGGFGGVLDTTDLSNNEVPPTLLVTGTGVAANYLLRIGNTSGLPPGTPICFGDGSGAACGCGNESDPNSASGCLNSVSTGGAGAALASFGTPSVSAPDLRLDASGVLTQPGLLFQGNSPVLGGDGLTFGDGIRCCGGGVRRLATFDPPPGPEPTAVSFTFDTTPPGVSAGDDRCYQYWYRDPAGPCASTFNLSSAVSVPWGP